MADVCMCTVTDHGHCGHVVDGAIVNDETVATLAQMAVLAAQAGADYVGASDMMDGRVGAIRAALEEAGHHSTGCCRTPSSTPRPSTGPSAMQRDLRHEPATGGATRWTHAHRSTRP